MLDKAMLDLLRALTEDAALSEKTRDAARAALEESETERQHLAYPR